MIATGGTLYAVVKDWRARGLTGPQRRRVHRRGGARRAAAPGQRRADRPTRARSSAPGTGPPITDPDTYATVKAILTDPARRRGVGKPPTTLLAGVLKCGKCGQRMNGAFRGVKQRRQHPAAATAAATGTWPGPAARWMRRSPKLVVARVEASAGTLTRPRKTASRRRRQGHR